MAATATDIKIVVSDDELQGYIPHPPSTCCCDTIARCTCCCIVCTAPGAVLTLTAPACIDDKDTSLDVLTYGLKGYYLGSISGLTSSLCLKTCLSFIGFSFTKISTPIIALCAYGACTTCGLVGSAAGLITYGIYGKNKKTDGGNGLEDDFTLSTKPPSPTIMRPQSRRRQVHIV